MYTVRYVKEISLIKKVYACMCIILCLVELITSKSTFSYIFLLLFGISLLITEGSEINLENKTYRTIKSIFGINFGKWKPCPKFEYASVFKTNKAIEVSSFGATIRNHKKDILIINLFYDGNKHITFYKTEDTIDAFRVAEHFKMAFDIAIHDATKR